MITTPQLIIESLGIAPIGSQKATAPGYCVMCGTAYALGDIVEPFAPGDSFTEYADLRNPSGSHVCGACKATWRKEFMQNYTKSVVCAEGLFPFFSNDAVAYWLLNPPLPPYAMFISTQQLGHIVWKVPVNHSRDLMLVRYNDKVLKIRRGHLLESIDAARYLSDRLLEAATQATPGGKPRKGAKAAARTFINPMILDRSLERANHGQFKPGIEALATDDSRAASAIATLQRATVGETWALAHILYTGELSKPEPKLAYGTF